MPTSSTSRPETETEPDPAPRAIREINSPDWRFVFYLQLIDVWLPASGWGVHREEVHVKGASWRGGAGVVEQGVASQKSRLDISHCAQCTADSSSSPIANGGWGCVSVNSDVYMCVCAYVCVPQQVSIQIVSWVIPGKVCITIYIVYPSILYTLF